MQDQDQDRSPLDKQQEAEDQGKEELDPSAGLLALAGDIQRRWSVPDEDKTSAGCDDDKTEAPPAPEGKVGPAPAPVVAPAPAMAPAPAPAPAMAPAPAPAPASASPVAVAAPSVADSSDPSAKCEGSADTHSGDSHAQQSKITVRSAVGFNPGFFFCLLSLPLSQQY